MGSVCAVQFAKSSTLTALRKLRLKGSKVVLLVHPQFNIPYCTCD